MPTPTAAANAYAALARLTDPSRGLAKPEGGGDAAGAGASFGSLLKNALGAVVDAGRKSDAQAQAMAAGKANVVDVVTAVAETEVAIESLVAVRDRVIQSYEEIMKMPI
jgi:flagellar hook-basal body complex protein FliE